MVFLDGLSHHWNGNSKKGRAFTGLSSTLIPGPGTHNPVVFVE
jgi:hypothetical protein